MNAEKVRNLTDGELKQQERDQMDQLFRLKFQMKMGQTESLNKIRSLRRGVARLKTITRERELGLHTSAVSGAARPAAKPAKAAKVKAAAPVAKAKATTAKVKAKAPAKKSAAKKSEKR